MKSIFCVVFNVILVHAPGIDYKTKKVVQIYKSEGIGFGRKVKGEKL